MLDFLFAAGQFVCSIGLLYGLILTIAHRDCVDTLPPHWDPIAGHEGLTIRVAPYRRREPLPSSRDSHHDAAPYVAERRTG